MTDPLQHAHLHLPCLLLFNTSLHNHFSLRIHHCPQPITAIEVDLPIPSHVISRRPLQEQTPHPPSPSIIFRSTKEQTSDTKLERPTTSCLSNPPVLHTATTLIHGERLSVELQSPYLHLINQNWGSSTLLDQGSIVPFARQGPVVACQRETYINKRTKNLVDKIDNCADKVFTRAQ